VSKSLKQHIGKKTKKIPKKSYQKFHLLFCPFCGESMLEEIMSFVRELKSAALELSRLGGRLLMVGGAVRDSLLEDGENFAPKDIDLLVFNVDLHRTLQIFESYGAPKLVGRKVFKGSNKGEEYIHLHLPWALLEISVRRDQDGNGIPFSQSSLKEDALKRDFTVNAMYQDILSGEYLDPLEGLMDLKRRVLNPTGPSVFLDDPLRLLRAFSLISRKGFHASPTLLKMASDSHERLSLIDRARFWPEWRGWSTSSYPHLGLRFLTETGLINFFGELSELMESPQGWRYHPEGSAWNHTLLVVQAMAELDLEGETGYSFDRCLLTLAALTHDIGKNSTSRKLDECSGRVFYPAHDEKGVPFADKFLKSINCPEKIRKGAVKLTRWHMEGSFTKFTPPRMRAIARALHPHATLADLWAIKKSDWSGRLYWPESYPYSLSDFLEPVNGVFGVPMDLLTGGEIREIFGLEEGPILGEILRTLRDAHDKGEIDSKDEAIKIVEKFLKGQNSKSPKEVEGPSIKGVNIQNTKKS
jgi:tRNA nucleotidyltransferase (CCA-adding enzyme)